MKTGCRISVADLCVGFGRGQPVLSDLTLEVLPGQFVSIVGASGSGKSTVLRCLGGLQDPTSGQIVRAHPSNRRPKIAYVFQDPTLLPWRNVAQNIELPLELAGVKQIDRRLASTRLIPLVGLSSEDATKRPRALSGGMRMRASLGRALATDPDLLLLDEPFAAIDDLARQQLNFELLRLWEAQRWTAVMVTHNISEAVFLSQRVIILGSRPARIVAEFEIPLDAPREATTRTSPEFCASVDAITMSLRESMKGGSGAGT